MEISPETQFADLTVVPDPEKAGALRRFPLIARMVARDPAMIEFFHNRKRGGERHARLWILSGGRPSNALADLGFVAAPDWPLGFYDLPRGFRTTLVVVSELPPGRETLMFRLVGAGATLQSALEEVDALPHDAPERSAVPSAMLKTINERPSTPTIEDERFRMDTQEYYERWKREQRDEGRVEGRVEGIRESLVRVLVARFGALDDATSTRLESASLDELSRWIERAVSATSVADVLDS